MSSGKHAFGFQIVIVAIAMLLCMVPVAAQEEAPVPETASAAQAHSFIAYYFYTTHRCPACNRIEAWTEEAILNGYEDKLASGMLQWRTIAVDEPAHRHFVSDYQLYTKSVILAEFKDGEQVRWKNLDRVWHLLRNKNAFIEYVRTEIDSWVKE